MLYSTEECIIVLAYRSYYYGGLDYLCHCVLMHGSNLNAQLLLYDLDL